MANTESFVKKMLKPGTPGLVLCLIALIIGVVIASLYWRTQNVKTLKNISSEVKPLRQSNNTYQFINPLLGYEVPGEVKEFNEYKTLEQEITQNSSLNNNSNLYGYSVYFRDLALGRWTGVNESIAYSPGSMMKVVIMIAYLKQAETDPSILDQKLTYASSTVDQINGVPFSSPSSLQVGQKYSVEQLIESMIVNSDNGAKDVLLDNLNPNDFIEIHTDLGLPNPTVSQNYTITPKQYSILLRVLYNATYLSRTYSEKALQILSQTTYKDGLVAGIPQGTAVAHKYGEAFDSSNSNAPAIILSDCGIIYHPTHPYLLCIMTKGKDTPTLANTISTISHIVWSEVNNYTLSKNY